MSDKATSAIDKIELILNKLNSLEELIEKKLKVIENDVKLLNNKVNKLSSPKETKASGPSATAPVPVVDQLVVAHSNELIKIFGKIKNQNKQPIENVQVRLFTPTGEILKTRATDSNGYWEARIPPGQYGVEYDPTGINKRLSPVNMTVNIKPGSKEYEIKGK